MVDGFWGSVGIVVSAIEPCPYFWAETLKPREQGREREKEMGRGRDF